MLSAVVLQELSQYGASEMWEQWEKQRRVCCLTNTEFVRHMLTIHSNYCHELKPDLFEKECQTEQNRYS